MSTLLEKSWPKLGKQGKEQHRAVRDQLKSAQVRPRRKVGAERKAKGRVEKRNEREREPRWVD